MPDYPPAFINCANQGEKTMIKESKNKPTNKDENSKDPKWQVPVEVPGSQPQEYPDRQLPTPRKKLPPQSKEES